MRLAVVTKWREQIHTVPTVNSCTKCVGSPGGVLDRTPIATQFPGNEYTDSVALICKQFGSLMRLAKFLTCYPCKFVQPGTGRRPVDWCRN